MTQIKKLTVLTREDLNPGYQAVQAAHAAIDFQHQFPKIARKWHKSNYLILLSVLNEKELITYIEVFKKFNLKHTIFREPDIGNGITAIAVQPSVLLKRICSKLPLALKHKK